MWIEEVLNWDICSKNGLSENFQDDRLQIPEWIQKIQRDVILWVKEDLEWLLEGIKMNFIRSQIRVDSWNWVLDELIYQEILSQVHRTLLQGKDTIVLDEYFIDETIHIALEKLEHLNKHEHEEVRNNGRILVIWNQEVNIQDYISDSTEEVESDLEAETGETLIDFLKQNWVPESSSEILFIILSTGWFFADDMSDTDRSIMISNLQVFIEFIVQIESFWWKNIKNNEWITDNWPSSSAKWPFQYLDWYINREPTLIPKRENWRIIRDEEWNTVMVRAFDRQEWRFSPFDTALNRVRRYYNTHWADGVPSWVEEAWNNQPDFSPLDLTWEQSINLWIIDSFTRGSWALNYLSNIITRWDSGAMSSFYNNIHHTRPSDAVRRNVRRHFGSHAERLRATERVVYTRMRPRERP